LTHLYSLSIGSFSVSVKFCQHPVLGPPKPHRMLAKFSRWFRGLDHRFFCFVGLHPELLHSKGPYIPFRLGWHPSQLPIDQKGPYLGIPTRLCISTRFFYIETRARNANDTGAAEGHASAPRRRTRHPAWRIHMYGSRVAARHFLNKKAQDSAQIFVSSFVVRSISS